MPFDVMHRIEVRTALDMVPRREKNNVARFGDTTVDRNACAGPLYCSESDGAVDNGPGSGDHW